MSTSETPKLGDESICNSCGTEISFTGKYWEHMFGSYRHVATPIMAPLRHPLNVELEVEQLRKELTAAKAEVEKLKQINDTQARELIERGKDIDTLKTAMHQSPTKLCHIDRDRAEQQRCKRCEAYLSDKRPAGRTLCEDCMRLPEHTYIPPVIIPPAKPQEIGWPLPSPPWGNISTTPLRDQNTP